MILGMKSLGWLVSLLGLLLLGALMFFMGDRIPAIATAHQPNKQVAEPATARIDPLSAKPSEPAPSSANANPISPPTATAPTVNPVAHLVVAKQVEPVAAPATPPSVQLAATQPLEPVATPVMAKLVLPEPVLPEPVHPTPAAKATVTLPELPAHLQLSDGELKKLSTKERKQYATMLKSLQEVRQQSAVLAEEKKSLANQLAYMEKRNQTLTNALDERRKILEAYNKPAVSQLSASDTMADDNRKAAD